MTALLIRRRRPIGEPATAVPTEWPFASRVEGTAGAGRICQELAELGISLAALTQLVIDADATPTELDSLAIDEPFETVVLGSHLVNLPDADARRAFLRAARRHSAATDGVAIPTARRQAVAPTAGSAAQGGVGAASGVILVEHHPLDWAETAAATTPTPGASVGMEDVRRDPPFVSAVSTFDFGGHYVRQPFIARVLSDHELDAELAAVGMVRARRLDPTWIEARVRP